MKAYVINLDSRPDRWTESQHLPFELERFPAVKHKEGWRGLLLTMQALFEQKYTGKEMLIFEDDALWVRPIRNFHAAHDQLPAEYDMMLLGANIKGTVRKYKPNLWRVDGAWTTHAVLYSPKFIEHLMAVMPTLDIPIDEYFRTKIHPRLKSYVVRPMVCYQRPSFSDIEGTHNDYTHLFEQSNALMF